MAIGVLALQGDFEEHGRALARAGAAWCEVRTAAEIRASEGLILPGGESTTLWRLMEETGIEEAVRELHGSGRPVLATCAGAILLADEVRHPDRRGLGLLTATVVRNAYGRQLESTVLHLTDFDRTVLGPEPLEAVFIRAPRIVAIGPCVEVLARRDGDPVLVRQGNLLAATFHPELTDDARVHRLFLEGSATSARRRIA